MENVENCERSKPVSVECGVGRHEWHEAYKARLIERGIDAEFAQATLEAAMDDFDYTDGPADAADYELSCWSKD